ncbi:radical SAM/SPASM domain-containing protein [Methylobacter tundripaludum]|uniref:radical SAM/SPASM domain-containing protein n=1 Tax=Methylobacter tundripaludum TaxID=173365 RepID=UPI00068B6832|nr:radical SAM/SPASM domain-containing protein [Methylobacter tundripaludum]
MTSEFAGGNTKHEESDSYGFYDRLKAQFPSQILADITEVCNLGCVHCPHPEFKKSEHYGARYLDPELNAKMVDEVKAHGQGLTQYIRYASNGEPLVHPQGYDMIEYAAINSGVYVTLTTNGTIMNERRTQRLLESKVHMIDVSIDAYSPDVYAGIRVGGDLDVTRTNVLKLISWIRESKSNTKVVVSFVEQPQNQHETADFESYWKDQGADYVVIRRLHSCSGAKTNLAEIKRHDNHKIERRPCLYPWERIVLNARGDLAFCPSDWVHGSFVSNYKETTILETWQGEFYQQLRNAHLTNRYQNHSFCGQCPDWESTRWPGSGRSYADMVEEFIEEAS